jgi:arylsulfatase A-like enzyme
MPIKKWLCFLDIRYYTIMFYAMKYATKSWTYVLYIGLVLLSSACSQPMQEIEQSNRDTIPELKNCLVFVLDTAASSHMDYTGYFRQTTPNIDQLIADRGILFTNAHSQSSTTVSSTWSYMTSQYCPGPADTLLGFQMRDWDYTFVDAFRDEGYATGGFSENPYITPELEYDHGFDTFNIYESLLPAEDKEIRYRKRNHDGTLSLMQDALYWIEAQKGIPWMTYLHILRPHNPYDAPPPLGTTFTGEPYRHMNEEKRSEKNMFVRWMYYMVSPNDADMEYYVGTYDGNLLYVDTLVDQFIKTLEKTGSLDDTLIVIMSDHGEGFLEHDRMGHNTTVYEEMVHVPLAFIFPKDSGFQPRNVDGLADLVDLFPTLADAFDLKHPEETHGTSLWPVISGEQENTDRTTSVSMINEATSFYIREGDMKLIVWLNADRKTINMVELFDMANDPAEKHNLFTSWESLGGLATKAENHIKNFATRKFEATDKSIDAGIIADLESLGYITRSYNEGTSNAHEGE